MCTSPSFIWVKRGNAYEQIPKPCGDCWSCRENYVSDWVGRCLCERSTSVDACTISLTYHNPVDPLDLSHKVVTPRHFQAFARSLRDRGHKIRYLAAGEYGELKDRAHFHAILFFSKEIPAEGPPPVLHNRAAFRADPSIARPFSRLIPQEEMVHIAEWPHGHVTVDWSMSEKAVRYCVQYLDRHGKKTGWFSMSKKPPLGFEWFQQKAKLYAEMGVLPSSFEYLPPGGKPGKKYLMTGATRRDFLNAVTTLRADRERMSPHVAKSFDKLERAEFIAGLSSGAQWADDHFSSRAPSEESVRASIRSADKKAQRGAYDFAMRLRSGKPLVDPLPPVREQIGNFKRSNGFVSVICRYDSNGKPKVWHVKKTHIWFEAAVFWAATNKGEPFTREWAEQYFQSGAGQASTGKSVVPAKLNPPSSYTREGSPRWGDPNQQYLATAYERKSEEKDPDA